MSQEVIFARMASFLKSGMYHSMEAGRKRGRQFARFFDIIDIEAFVKGIEAGKFFGSVAMLPGVGLVG